jgi:ATP adenylyltransferase
MNYDEMLKKDKNCPFCEFGRNKTIKTIRKAKLTYAIAPYCTHHLLVTPERHIESFEELTSEEKIDIDEMLLQGIKFLKVMGHEGYSILLRNGKKTGKTIEHLHYHIIPSIEVGSWDSSHINRKIMTEEEIDDLLELYKKAELEIK